MSLSHRFSLWRKKDPLRSRSCLFAIVLHGITLGFFAFSPSHKTQKTSSKMVVHTIMASNPSTLKPSLPASKASPTSKTANKKASLPPPPVKEKSKPSPKTLTKSSPPKSTIKKETKKNAPSPLKTPPPPPSTQELQKNLQKIEETIAKIATKSDTIPLKRASNALPKVEVESLFPSEEEDYVSLLVHHLQCYLQLPDMGEVKIMLVLNSNGIVETVKVLSAESVKNRKRLEEELPTLHFPPFPKEQQKGKTKEFIFTFCNE